MIPPRPNTHRHRPSPCLSLPPLNQPINQSTKQPSNQSINQPIHQPIHQSIYPPTYLGRRRQQVLRQPLVLHQPLRQCVAAVLADACCRRTGRVGCVSAAAARRRFRSWMDQDRPTGLHSDPPAPIELSSRTSWYLQTSQSTRPTRPHRYRVSKVTHHFTHHETAPIHHADQSTRPTRSRRVGPKKTPLHSPCA